MKDNKYIILILMFLLIMLLFYFLFKNIIGLPPESGTEIEKQENYNAVTNDNSENRDLLGKGRMKYDVFKPKVDRNTEEDSLGDRLRSGDLAI